jgi:hypothetical protein
LNADRAPQLKANVRRLVNNRLREDMVNKSDGFPIILAHRDAVGIERGCERVASVIPQLAILLVARGANRIVIPAPDPKERERIDSGLDRLPVERRGLVQVADQKGQLIRQVCDYLEPLRRQAKKWPEDAFVAFASKFLYEVSLGLTHRVGVLSSSASVVRDFIPIVDPSQFSGEARFRLAEIFRMVCAYEPAAVDQGLFQIDRPNANTSNALSIMEDAKFKELVVASGRIGYLKHPILGFQQLRKRFVSLMARPVVKGTMSLASTAVDAAGGAGMGAAAVKAIGLATPDSDEPFNPPFISLGPADLSLYVAVLREQMPAAIPPPGQIMAFRSRSGYSWLSVGEEDKLAREASASEAPRLAKYQEALTALDRLVR